MHDHTTHRGYEIITRAPSRMAHYQRQRANDVRREKGQAIAIVFDRPHSTNSESRLPHGSAPAKSTVLELAGTAITLFALLIALGVAILNA